MSAAITRGKRADKPTGYVAVCTCGAIIGVLDYGRTERSEAGKIMGKWLRDGYTVAPRFAEAWSEKLSLCRCAVPSKKIDRITLLERQLAESHGGQKHNFDGGV